jgi:hypothetical protein
MLTRFLYQIDSDANAIPLWHVGGPITNTSSISTNYRLPGANSWDLKKEKSSKAQK